MLSDDQRKVLERLQRCGVQFIGATQTNGYIHVLPESANTRTVRGIIVQHRTLLRRTLGTSSGALIAHLLAPPTERHSPPRMQSIKNDEPRAILNRIHQKGDDHAGNSTLT